MSSASSPRRNTSRLPSFDYTQPGAYFVTLVTWNRMALFGNVEDGVMHLSDWGTLAQQEWLRLENRFPHLELGEVVVMPNHLHGIICYLENQELLLGTIIGAYKSNTSRIINAIRRSPGALVWQRNYYDHIIRSQNDWEKIHLYIQSNPVNWMEDEENLR